MTTTVKTKLKFMSPTEIEEKASTILKQHGLFSIPVDPVILANRAGIKVNNAVFSDENLSGILTKRDNETSILISQSESPYRKRFTIAHELGHLFLHLEGEGEFIDTKVDLFRDTESIPNAEDDRIRYEIQANMFASSLLMPETFVKEYYKEIKDVSELARLFKVSEAAMSVRLTKLGLV